MKNLKIALLQIQFLDEIETQQDKIHQLIQTLKKDVAVIVLPEISLYKAEMAFQNIENNTLTLDYLLELSKAYKKVIIGGALVNSEEGIKNRTYVVYPNGAYTHYDKHQLFGQESEILTPGHKHLIVQINGWKFLLQTCYDLRFPEWSRMNEQEYHAIIYLAQWPSKRIHAWDTLLQARAIENMSYVFATNRVGEAYPGHSQVINPLGEIEEYSKELDAVLEYTLVPENILSVRAQFPFLETRDKFLIIPTEEVE